MKNTMMIKLDGETGRWGDGARRKDGATGRLGDWAKKIAFALLPFFYVISLLQAESGRWPSAFAQSPSRPVASPLLFAQSPSRPVAQSLVQAVDSVGFTVSDVDASVEFFSKVLSFEKVYETEVIGDEYEHLQGVFGLRMRVVRMKLGDEFIELTEYLAPRGRPIPVDSRSNDRWFQHIAIITSDME